MTVTAKQLGAVLGHAIGIASSVGLETHGPFNMAADELLLEERIEGATAAFAGNRVILSVKLADLVAIFGPAAAPTYAALRAINDSPTPDAKGYGKYLDDWHAKGLLA